MHNSSVQLHTVTEEKNKNPLRFVTAASLFDGHDAAINIVRRILQAAGAEVIHLGHNRSVAEIVDAAICEDVHGISISSYQGGHMEYFKYVVDLLKERGAEHIKVFGGGGGVITPHEIAELQAYGVCRIYSPEDGQKNGLKGMIHDMFERAERDLCANIPADLDMIKNNPAQLAHLITAIEESRLDEFMKISLRQQADNFGHIPVLGITGTGGAGKSSLTDELIRRFRQDKDDIKMLFWH